MSSYWINFFTIVMMMHNLALISGYKDCRDITFDERDVQITHYKSVQDFITTSDGKACKIHVANLNELRVLRSNQLNADPRSYYIRKLVLSDNGITTIEDNPFVASGTCLVVVDLSHNNISSIYTGAFTTLKHLQKLDLSYNAITQINYYSFSPNNKMDVLNIEHNNLADVDSLKIFKNLTILNVSYNKLKLLAGAFKILPKLRTLSMEYNDLGIIPLGLFEGLPLLEELKLGGNNIQTLKTGVFSGLKSLIYLNMSNNLLTTREILDEKVLFPIAKIRTIILDGNNVTDLDAELVNRVLPHLHYIGVKNMSWNCDELLEFFKGCQKRFIDMSSHIEGTYTETNIHGVGCREHSTSTTTSTTTAATTKRTTTTTTTTTSTTTEAPIVTTDSLAVPAEHENQPASEHETASKSPVVLATSENNDSHRILVNIEIVFLVLIVIGLVIFVFLMKDRFRFGQRRFENPRYVNKYSNHSSTASIDEPECQVNLV